MPHANDYDALGKQLVGFILSRDVIASQIDRILAGSVIRGDSSIAPLTHERHAVTVGKAEVAVLGLGAVAVTLPLDIRLSIELPLTTDVYEFQVKVALTLTALVTGPLSLFLAAAPVAAGDVTILREELLSGLVDLEFFISGALRTKVAEEVNRVLGEKEAERRVDLVVRVAQALGVSPPGANSPDLDATGS